MPVHLVLDSVSRRVAFAEELANYFEAALSRMFDAPFGKKFHGLADAIFVLCHADTSGTEHKALAILYCVFSPLQEIFQIFSPTCRLGCLTVIFQPRCRAR